MQKRLITALATVISLSPVLASAKSVASTKAHGGYIYESKSGHQYTSYHKGTVKRYKYNSHGIRIEKKLYGKHVNTYYIYDSKGVHLKERIKRDKNGVKKERKVYGGTYDSYTDGKVHINTYYIYDDKGVHLKERLKRNVNGKRFIYEKKLYHQDFKVAYKDQYIENGSVIYEYDPEYYGYYQTRIRYDDRGIKVEMKVNEYDSPTSVHTYYHYDSQGKNYTQVFRVSDKKIIGKTLFNQNYTLHYKNDPSKPPKKVTNGKISIENPEHGKKGFSKDYTERYYDSNGGGELAVMSYFDNPSKGYFNYKYTYYNSKGDQIGHYASNNDKDHETITYDK